MTIVGHKLDRQKVYRMTRALRGATPEEIAAITEILNPREPYRGPQMSDRNDHRRPQIGPAEGLQDDARSSGRDARGNRRNHRDPQPQGAISRTADVRSE